MTTHDPSAIYAAGLTITSTGTPALDGVYALDSASQFNISSVMLGIAAGQGLPGGGSTFNYLDTSGTPHSFDVTNFTNFAVAVRDYITAIIYYAQGITDTPPSSTVTIA